jgi:hypothetical protein
MKPAQILLSIAKQREQAYKAYGVLDGQKLRAISNIKRVSQFFIKSDSLNWARQIKSDLIAILPNEDSKQQKAREKIIEILRNIS